MTQLTRRYRQILATGLVLSCIGGCAATSSWIWPYYAPHMDDACYDRGVLWGKAGKAGWPDVSMTACKPDPEPSPGASPGPQPVRMKCVVLKIDDFYALKAAYLKLEHDLVSCQQGPPPNAPTTIE